MHHMEIGCRIPKDYFWVIGWGESNVGIETGSYDAALTMAGIENFNVMLYTSVLPPEAVELPHLPEIHHGSVLEGIIAIQHTEQPNTRITAGFLIAKVFVIADESYLGGFACEYAGHDSVEEAERNLHTAMNELFARRYSSTLYRLEFGKSVVRTFTPSNAIRNRSRRYRLRLVPLAGDRQDAHCHALTQRQIPRPLYHALTEPLARRRMAGTAFLFAVRSSQFRLPFAVCRLPFAVRRSPFATRYSLLAIRYFFVRSAIRLDASLCVESMASDSL